MSLSKEILMATCWSEYRKTKDIAHLIRAVENAPFFGQSEMGPEIARLLAKVRISKGWRQLV